MALTAKQKKMITDRLEELSIAGCPMYGGKAMTIGDEIVAASSVSLGGTTAIGGPFIPMAQIVCNQCGFVSHHALGALGINVRD